MNQLMNYYIQKGTSYALIASSKRAAGLDKGKIMFGIMSIFQWGLGRL